MSSLVKHNRRAHRTHVQARRSSRVRLLVVRSLRAIYAHLIDDASNKVLGTASSLKGKSGVEGAGEVGKAIAAIAKKNKIAEVVFDRNGYRYHGQVKAVAESAREAGLSF